MQRLPCLLPIMNLLIKTNKNVGLFWPVARNDLWLLLINLVLEEEEF